MLEALSIQNIVLIDDLHINFKEGLCVLTGETGAGKSILLDALGLALGARAEGRLLRQGADKAQVTAIFSLLPAHSLWRQLEVQGIPYEGNEVIFRRVLESDGKSRCFVNDQLISQASMRQLGKELVEIHGQFDQLLEPRFHLKALDAYGKVETTPLQEAFKAYEEAKKLLSSFLNNLAKSAERKAFLEFAIEEIEKTNPRQGEEEELESERALISHRAKIAEALLTVDQSLLGALTGLSQSHKALSRIQDLMPSKISPLLETCDRGLIESQEALNGIKEIRAEVEGTQMSLETLENRLYSLRNLSRKYHATDLVSFLSEMKEELSTLEQGQEHLEGLQAAVEEAKNTYLKQAEVISKMRKKAAEALQRAISQELPPLKLEHARFIIKFKKLPEEVWGSSGIDQVEFYIQTNPGLPEGPLSVIASGGELSRLMLALKVVLVRSSTIPTLIFDEIESGTGGSVAAAIGERLKVLSQNIQILSITHAPQIAAFGSQHLVVFKVVEENRTRTYVKTLSSEERQEEVARMLAGEQITEEARAAAKRLIAE